MHKFSIIMPLYNKASYVRKAIDSVLSQTYKNWELIVVDDGSTDESYRVANECISNSQNGKCTLIEQSNSGVGATRNNGVKLAKNDYLCFLDSDDWYEPTFLEEMDKFIYDYPDAAIYATDYYYVKNKKKRLDYKADTGYINYCKVYSKSNSMPVTSSSVCVLKKVFNEFEGFAETLKLGEDFYLWIRVALNYRVAFLNKPLSNYNQDVDETYRLTRHLHKPEHHMLFNLSELELYEKSNADYKRLIDKLRVNGLMNYWMSDEYHDRATTELKKVYWGTQSKYMFVVFKLPISLLRLMKRLHIYLSSVKQMCLRLLYNGNRISK